MTSNTGSSTSKPVDFWANWNQPTSWEKRKTDFKAVADEAIDEIHQTVKPLVTETVVPIIVSAPIKMGVITANSLVQTLAPTLPPAGKMVANAAIEAAATKAHTHSTQVISDLAGKSVDLSADLTKQSAHTSINTGVDVSQGSSQTVQQVSEKSMSFISLMFSWFK